MRYEEIVEKVAELVAECERYAKEYGDRALELVAEYPLYASKCNISFGEAILIASIWGNIDRQTNGAELVNEYFKTLPKGQTGSWEEYEKWVAERNKK